MKDDVRKTVRRLYRNVDGFSIPKSEEKHVRASKGSPVYGELTPTGIARLLEYLKLGPRDVFYDLGAGSGKVVIQTALTARVRKAIGVELASTRVADANRVLRAARGAGLLRARACAFREQDLLETYLSDATVIYTCSTAFSNRFLTAIASRVATLRGPIRFLTLQELADPPARFKRVATLRVETTWTRRCGVAVYHVPSVR